MKLETMSARTRVTLGIGIVLILAATVVFAWWAMRTEYSVLFSRLTEADAAGIVAELKKQKTEYQLADGGTTIRVPADRVHDVRLALMSSGTPIAGGVGFEIFDRQGLGATEQSQRVSFQRALQGELARTIGALEGVNQARVHLVLPESTLFRRDRQDARASVSLKLEPGVVLQNPQIFGIQRLVAAAVPGLDIGRVVVTDQHGLTLSAADALTVGGATGEGRLSMKREVEEYVTRKIVALLDRAYGPGRAIVSVDATLNFDEVRRTVQDLLPPNGQNVRRRRQTTGGAMAVDASAFDDAGAGARGSIDTEYDYGRRVEQVVAAPGGVTRLSVGVIVPGATDLATLQRIEDLVRVAAGINDSRDDLVVVQSLDGLGPDTVGAVAPVTAVLEPVEQAAAAPAVAIVATPWWNHWYVWAGAGLLFAALFLLALLGRGGGSGERLSADERAKLLADVRASLERGGPRMTAAGGAS
ncbi:MAG TPA: flagellar basal-body MS-ring/collar protein FliF [Steroidobacteraceae bacterium]